MVKAKVRAKTAAAKAPSLGSRFNHGKVRYDLLPWRAIGEVARVSTFGAAKYAPRNWERGLTASGCFASCQRHLRAWWGGEDRDEESGLPHLAHAAWNCLAALAFQLVGRDDLDDRPELDRVGSEPR